MRAIFMGTPEFAVKSLETLHSTEGVEIVAVITQVDKKQGRKQVVVPPPVKTRALELNLPVRQFEKIKSTEAKDYIKALEPDVIIVTAYGQILPKEVLDCPKIGCINVHASILPRHRGAAPINYSIISGDKETGITTMFMDTGLDTGDIILVDKLPISEDDDSISLTEKLANLSVKTLSNTLNMLKLKIEIPRVKQDESLATYAPMMNKKTGHLDFNNEAKDIINLVRGTKGWPGSYFNYGDKKIMVHKIVDTKIPSKEKPSTIVSSEDTIVIATATTDVAVLKMQVPGKKPVDTVDYLRGNKIEVGTIVQ